MPLLIVLRAFRLTALASLTLLALHLSALAQTPQMLAREWDAQHVTRLAPSELKHTDLKRHLDELRAAGISVREVGRSVTNREIYEMEYGRGPLKVFMWSQMHGDEPTATSALIDIFHFLQKNRAAPWVKQIERRLTIRAVPMLNPDGAELYQRHNLQHIDINRDARRLATPEGRLLKRLRDEWSPHIGFNLHNQNPRTAVGDTRRQATISFLAVAADARGTVTPGRLRNKRLCGVMIRALEPFIKGHIGRYDDSFNPRAFGDMIGAWGTPVILVETGALRGKDEMYLIRLNFVALLSALDALATNNVRATDSRLYDSLPYNAGGTIFDLVVRNATIINRPAQGTPRFETFADLSINESASVRNRARRASVQELGDLSGVSGLLELDATGFYVTAPTTALRPGADGVLLFYRKDRAIDWKDVDIETRYPPDALYRNGEWHGKEKLKIINGR